MISKQESHCLFPRPAGFAGRLAMVAAGYVVAMMGAGSCNLAWAGGWSAIATPTHDVPRAIGQTGNGCIAGAGSLPLRGEGYLVMHLERRRYFGHPNLLRTIEALGREVALRGIGPLQIGDLSQPRGGPMPFGHRSHQTGLDADIWFNLDPALLSRADAQRANLNAPSMLSESKIGVNRSIWGDRQVAVMELAAGLPEVDRIFVNPYIKQDLCGRVKGDRAWLRKIRPWYGHHDHFHLRLICPPGSPECEPQEPIPAGDGCDASLEWWLQQPQPAPPVKQAEAQPMPAECRALLARP